MPRDLARPPVEPPAPPGALVVLYWIPLGAGASVVRRSGRLFEALSARIHHRVPCDLYHSALEVSLAGGRSTIEMTPVPAGRGQDRGVVAEGTVGLRWLGHLRVFRYEIRCWPGGAIPDAGAAVGGPVVVTGNPLVAGRILDLAASVPTPVWGRDELAAGEMWNSNSVTAWLLAGAGVDLASVRPPPAGRAPGWDAGRVVAGRARRSPDQR